MIEKTLETRCGSIHYWVNEKREGDMSLVFLPGLTADHRLFEKQIEHFEEKCHVLVWDAPAHASSAPFDFSFDLKDKAIWLDEIFRKEKIEFPVIIGQSMGGYVGQMYSQLSPNKLKGFIAIDSAPLQRKYVTAMEIWFSCSVMSDSLQPHESQHTRPPCPSPTPGVHSNSCPWSW